MTINRCAYGISYIILNWRLSYRHNDINVDGGCCFRRNVSEYPCMLCAICLETLEEFYSHTLEDRFMEEYAAKKQNRYRQELLEKLDLV